MNSCLKLWCWPFLLHPHSDGAGWNTSSASTGVIFIVWQFVTDRIICKYLKLLEGPCAAVSATAKKWISFCVLSFYDALFDFDREPHWCWLHCSFSLLRGKTSQNQISFAGIREFSWAKRANPGRRNKVSFKKICLFVLWHMIWKYVGKILFYILTI